TRTCREIDQVYRRQKAGIATQRQHGHFITEVPDGITRPGQPSQVLAFRGIFDPILEGQHRHYCPLYLCVSSRMARSSAAGWMTLSLSAIRIKRRRASSLNRWLLTSSAP